MQPININTSAKLHAASAAPATPPISPYGIKPKRLKTSVGRSTKIRCTDAMTAPNAKPRNGIKSSETSIGIDCSVPEGQDCGGEIYDYSGANVYPDDVVIHF